MKVLTASLQPMQQSDKRGCCYRGYSMSDFAFAFFAVRAFFRGEGFTMDNRLEFDKGFPLDGKWPLRAWVKVHRYESLLRSLSVSNLINVPI